MMLDSEMPDGTVSDVWAVPGVSVRLNGSSLIIEELCDLLFPLLVTRSDKEPDLTFNVSVVQSFGCKADCLATDKLPPKLTILNYTKGGLRIIKKEEEGVVLFREADDDTDAILISIEPLEGRFNIELLSNEVRSVRAAARFMKYILGCALAKSGSQVLHASSVVVNDTLYLLHGPRGAGKSSLLFRMLLSGGAFLSDDLTIFDPYALRFLGWPKRIALSLSAIKPSEATSIRLGIRRADDDVGASDMQQYAGHNFDTSSRKRLKFDIIEFLEIFSFQCAATYKNVVEIYIKYDPNCSGHLLQQTTEEFASPLAHGSEMWLFTDYLSLLHNRIVRKELTESRISGRRFVLTYSDPTSDSLIRDLMQIEIGAGVCPNAMATN